MIYLKVNLEEVSRSGQQHDKNNMVYKYIQLVSCCFSPENLR